MIEAANILLWMMAAVILVPVAVFVIESVAALLSRRGRAAVALPRPAAAVLIPAHNEEAHIGQTVSAVLGQLRDGDRLVVVADNCTDGTAQRVRELGGEAIERTDPDRRGKGFALDFGVRHLAQDPREIVIVIDADCRLGEGTIDHLAAAAARHDGPVQALDLLDPPVDPSFRDYISALAFLVKNLIRPLGLQTLGQPCLLMGTGMALPWRLLQNAKLASGNIVEDMQLGLDLAIAGHTARLCTDAMVRGHLAGGRGAMKQRRRWEHGHLQTLFSQGPRVLLEAMKQLRIDLFATFLELTVPPLSLLVLTWMGASAVAAGAWLAGVSPAPLVALLIGGAMLALAVFGGWARFAREMVPLRMLLGAPLYAMAKLPVYVAFAFHREKTWVRADRPGGERA